MGPLLAEIEEYAEYSGDTAAQVEAILIYSCKSKGDYSQIRSFLTTVMSSVKRQKKEHQETSDGYDSERSASLM